MTDQDDLKIIRLRGENVKALKAVELSFDEDDHSIVVKGNNAQGKSTLLDLIAFAWCGKRSLPEEPLPDGETKGTIEVGTNGPFSIKRTITENDSYLTVRNEDGEEYDSPQSLLNSMRGKLFADPYQFRGDSPRQTREKFLDVLDLDLDLEEWENRREELYEDRKRAKKKLKGLQEELGEVEPDPDLPSEPIEVQELIDEVSTLEEQKRELEEMRDDADKLEAEAEDAEGKASQKRSEAERLLKEADELEDEADEKRARADELREEASGELTPKKDAIEEKKAEIKNLEQKNEAIRKKQRILERERKFESRQDEVDELEAQVDALWAEKREAIENADFPVSGLTADEGEIEWNGTPLDQLSQAERIYLFSALAMARNPDLRVLMIPDASLLDSEWLEKLKDLADEQDYQLFLECVHEASGDMRVEIREGEVESVTRTEGSDDDVSPLFG